MLDPVEFGKAMGALFEEKMAPLRKRIEELEARQPQPGLPGEPGKDGKSVTLEDVAPIIADSVQKAVSEIPKPKDGEPGKDGKNADRIEIKDVAIEIARAPEMKTVADLLVAEAVQNYFAENPVKRGEPGKNGDNVTDEQVAKAVASHLKENPPAKGEDGKDGVGIAGAMIDREGALIVTTTKGEAVRLGKVVGDNGKPGNDGQDFGGAEIDYDGERTLTIKNKTGGVIVKRMPIPMDKGYYRDGMSAEKGDIVTHNGNAWIALRDTKAKPSHEAAEDWRLFARKGKDGVDGAPGRNLGPAPAVKLSA